MSITYHQLGTSFDLDATEWDGTVYSVVNAYRHVSTINTEWQCTYEHCHRADKSRLKFLATQYARIPQLSARLNQMSLDDADLTYFDVVVTQNGYIEYILLATRNGENGRDVLIVDCRQNREVSLQGWLLSLGMTAFVAYFNPYYALGSLVVKLAVDYKLSRIDCAKIAALKYLESRGLVNVDLTAHRVTLLTDH